MSISIGGAHGVYGECHKRTYCMEAMINEAHRDSDIGFDSGIWLNRGEGGPEGVFRQARARVPMGKTRRQYRKRRSRPGPAPCFPGLAGNYLGAPADAL